MRNQSKLMKEILEELRETSRLINEMSQSFIQMMKRMIPEGNSAETIQKGGPIAEITVRSPEKLEQWRSLFESRGMRVEYYEPFRTDGEEYFAKLWGYLENNNNGKNGDESAAELKHRVLLSQEKPS
jgi:ATP-dependent RNA circularization protein (DNA/RNA ligase family)